MFGEAEQARWYAVSLSYASILGAIMLLVLAFVGYSEFSDEKLMSTVVFTVIAFVEMIGSVFVVTVWQPHKVYTVHLCHSLSLFFRQSLRLLFVV